MNILCDIGGSKIRIAESKDGTTFDNATIEKTPQKYEEGIALLRKRISKNKDVENICIAIAGTLNKEKTGLIFSPNLPDWVNKNIVSDLGTVNVCLENDTAIIGLGEAVAGAGKKSNILAYITVSTGVGGARISDKKIDKSILGFEPGHQIVDIDESTCPECELVSHKGVGHLDNMISGRAIKEKYGKDAKEVTEKKVWNKHAIYLATGLYNAVVFWSPDTVILGGAMITGDPAIDIDLTKEKLKEKLAVINQELPEIKKAELGEEAAFYGWLEYLKKII